MKLSSDWQRDWAALRPDQQAALIRRNEWLDRARPNQLPPEGSWDTWLVLAGRGFGKTRLGMEDAAWYGLTNPGARIAIIAPTSADVRDTCIEGNSGLRACLPDEAVEAWNRSLGELILANGTRYKAFSADEPDRLRGPQHHRAYCDELAAWRYPEAWDQMLFGLRLGQHPQAIVTTTPRPTKLVRDILASEGTAVTRGSTFDNAENLAASAIETLRKKYEGTRLGRQELYAEILDDVPGALWNRALLEKNRDLTMPCSTEEQRMAWQARMKRIVVAMDPAATNTETSDEMGIIVAGLGHDDEGYIFEDLSERMSPDAAARKAIAAYDRWNADRIVGEVNNGGDWIGSTVNLTAKAMKAEGVRESANVAYKSVHASRGKKTRAEPIAALDEQGRVHHVGGFPELEDQLCTWEPLGGQASPDRMDARVWALTELMLGVEPAMPIFGTYGRQRS